MTPGSNGMTNRMPQPKHLDNRPIWELWDRFGIKGSEMIGYWYPLPPGRIQMTQSPSTCWKPGDTITVPKGKGLLIVIE